MLALGQHLHQLLSILRQLLSQHGIIVTAGSAITVSVLQMVEGPADIEERAGVWLEQHRRLVDRWKLMLGELRSATTTDYAMYAVANRELMDLAQSA